MSSSLAGGSLGEQQHLVGARGFVVSETTHPIGFSAPRHAHERASLNIVLGGAYAERIRGASVLAERGTVIIKPGGESHSNDFRFAPARCLLIELTEPEHEHVARSTALFDRVMTTRSDQALALAVRIVSEIRVPDAMAAFAVEGLTLELVTALTRRTERWPTEVQADWVERVREFLHDGSGPLSVRDVAELVHRHPATIARTFRLRFHCSMGEYSRRVRLERAAQALIESDAPVSAIAQSCGFYDHAHFARAFRRTMGAPPSVFRAVARRVSGTSAPGVQEP